MIRCIISHESTFRRVICIIPNYVVCSSYNINDKSTGTISLYSTLNGVEGIAIWHIIAVKLIPIKSSKVPRAYLKAGQAPITIHGRKQAKLPMMIKRREIQYPMVSSHVSHNTQRQVACHVHSTC
ncbi:hypothetical protein VNO77_21245 [Canavalia gladiata]|uniref:Uncharacterized protein n=1 Tax=Canavalia gladiata TaxID=3824 RepID=A0AAN9LU75_CANGL